MTESQTSHAGNLRPLLFGRLARIILGMVSLFLAIYFGSERLGLAGMVDLVFLGVSFLVRGLIGNPGCELSALPNLVLPTKKRIHFP